MRWIACGSILGCLSLSACGDDVAPVGATEGSSGAASSDSDPSASISQTSNSTSNGSADTNGGDATMGSGGPTTGGSSSGTAGVTSTSGTDSSSGGGSGSTSSGGESTGPDTTTGVGTTAGSSTDAGQATSGTDTGGSSSDTGGPPVFCDLFAQDCPVGEKCMPYGPPGTELWSDLGCFPIDESPAQVGDECEIIDDAVSGEDTCDIAAMCWDTDPDVLTGGECVAMCGGTELAPTCDDPDTGCVIANGGLIVLCLPTCDPLLQDCAGQGCYPVNAGFFCAPDASGVDGAVGDTCATINGCDPGAACVDGGAFGPACGGANCCAALCAVSGGDLCPIGNQECVPWYEEGEAPLGFEDVGVCAVP